MYKPIRILHVLGRLDRGGAETSVMNIYRNIDRVRIQFDFMKHTEDKCDYDEEILQLGGRIYSIPKYYCKNYFVYKNNWLNFFNIHPEHKIVHGHTRSTASIYLQIAKKNGLKTIAHSHSTASRGNLIQKSVKNIMQLPIRHIADYLFACSQEAGEWLFGKNATKKSNFKIIKNAINIEKYIFRQGKRREIRQNLAIGNRFVIGHVGSFTYPKNHKFLLNVFIKIKEKKPNAVLLLLGEGILKASIIMQVNSLGLKDKVVFTGNVPNVNDYLQAMDVFIFPSIFEGLPVSLIEAQATGLPCIISDRITKEVQITDLIEFISLEKSASDWADKTINIINNFYRKNTYKKIVGAGYDIKAIAKWYEDFYINQFIKYLVMHNQNCTKFDL